MATIQERDGKQGKRWRVVYRVDGKQRVDVFTDPDKAARHVALIDRYGGEMARRILDAREAAPREQRSLADHAADYVARLEGVTDGTRKDYRGMIANRLEPSILGQLPLVAVDREAVAAWVRDLPGSTKTRRNYHALVSAALASAVDEGLIPSNPARGVKIKQAEPVSSMVFLSAGEFAVLLSAVPADYRPLIATLAGTGMRWGEATALTVGDVDLDAQPPRLRITKAWKRTGAAQTVLGPPKTRAGIRTLGLPSEVAEVLRPLVEGRPSDVLVFTKPDGSVVRQAWFHRYVWKPSLDRAAAGGLTKRPRIHDLRHTHASQLVASGLPLNAVQVRLGHESITTTVDRYSHLAPDYLALTAQASSLGLAQALPQIEG